MSTKLGLPIVEEVMMVEGADPDYEAFFRGLIERTVQAAARIVGDHMAAEDVAVEAMVRAHRRWDKLAKEPYREAWVL